MLQESLFDCGLPICKEKNDVFYITVLKVQLKTYDESTNKRTPCNTFSGYDKPSYCVSEMGLAQGNC